MAASGKVLVVGDPVHDDPMETPGVEEGAEAAAAAEAARTARTGENRDRGGLDTSDHRV